MADIASISAALTGLKSAIDIAKTLRELDKQYDAAAAKQKHIDLLEKLMDAKEAVLMSRDLLLEKDLEISSLREKLRVKHDVVRYKEGYYDTTDSGDPIGDPYCAKCYEADNKLIHTLNWGGGERRCPQCGMMSDADGTPALSRPFSR